MIWLFVPLLAAAVVAGVAFACRRRPLTAIMDIGTGLAVLASGCALLALTRSGDVVRVGLLRADAASSYLLIVVGLVAVVSLWGGLADRTARSHTDGHLTALVSLFLGAMSLALCTDNLGLLWVAIEATTITTAFLVGHHRDKGAIEAAWKYVLLGSVGIAIAFLGVVLLLAAAQSSGHATLSWPELVRIAPTLNPGLTKLAVSLTVLGFATKAGLAPMHAWLPDAHSQAPAPVSGLMSGVLLSVAFYAILRVQTIADAALGPHSLRWLLIGLGLFSLLVAALLTLTQRDYKRLLAYSSIEHMGIVAVAAGIGGKIALGCIVIHVLGHGLAKSVAFVQAGRIAELHGSTRIDAVQGLLARRPDIAWPFVGAMISLLGFPPFVLFISELGLIYAGVQAKLTWVVAVAALLILITFAGISRQLVAMLLGPGDGTPPSRVLTRASVQIPVWIGLALGVAATVALIPGRDLIMAAITALGGH